MIIKMESVVEYEALEMMSGKILSKLNAAVKFKHWKAKWILTREGKSGTETAHVRQSFGQALLSA